MPRRPKPSITFAKYFGTLGCQTHPPVWQGGVPYANHSVILVHTVTTCYEYVVSITQKHVLKSIHTTKIVSSPSNKIIIIQKNVCSVLVKVLAYFSRACKETEYSE
jgi:hypothetical protein